MAEICTRVSSGGTPSRSNDEYFKGEIPWIRTQEVNFGDILSTELKISEKALENSSAKWIPKNTVIVAMYGATAGKVAISKIASTTNQACANLEVDESKANYRYVFHFLMQNYENLKSLGQGTQSNLNLQQVKNYLVPLPHLSVQEAIAEKLDCFQALTQSLSSGLPSEIEARRKQYEYYRHKLLSFKELV